MHWEIEYMQQREDFLTGYINQIAPHNVLYFITKWWLEPLEDTPVLDIKEMRDNQRPMVLNSNPF